jgi:hypothetical protein
LAVIGGKLTVVFRDPAASDGVENVWLNRMSVTGTWSGWARQTVPSFTTPGIAEATDGNEYLAYVVAGLSARPIRFARRPAGSSAPWQLLAYPRVDASILPDDPSYMRTRITLLFRRYRGGFLGTELADQSGYLAVFWNAGDPNYNNHEYKSTWRQYRAYTPGRISPTEDAFASIPSRWRAQGQTTRPYLGHSTAAVARHWDVEVVYTGIEWDIDPPPPRGVFYVPYAGGTPISPPDELHDDLNDIEVIRKNLCLSIRSFYDQPMQRQICGGTMNR